MGWLLFLILGHGSAPPDGTLPEHFQNVAHMQETMAIGKPNQKATWGTPPAIRVCTDSGVSVSRTTRAIKYWERLGYEFGGIVGDPFSMCMTPKPGEVLITIPDRGFSGTHMAATRLYTDMASGEIVRAKIQILPHNAAKDRVLEHEIGHALGWEHYPQRYHIMHPTWKYGGYDSYGVRKR